MSVLFKITIYFLTFSGTHVCPCIQVATPQWPPMQTLVWASHTFLSQPHVQYTQTESNRLKAKTIRVSSRIKDFRLTGSPFSGTRL